jgi:hypothetical protein
MPRSAEILDYLERVKKFLLTSFETRISAVISSLPLIFCTHEVYLGNELSFVDFVLCLNWFLLLELWQVLRF